MIQKINETIIGSYAVYLAELAENCYVWVATKICYYRDSPIFPVEYKLAFKPCSPFSKYISKDDFYTDDINFEFIPSDPSETKQPDSWSPIIVIGDKYEAIEYAKNLNNLRNRENMFPNSFIKYPKGKEILEEFGVIFY